MSPRLDAGRSAVLDQTTVDDGALETVASLVQQDLDA
jgi:hypothetical protein